MNQHLDTIPLWDAYKADCECPLCRVRAINEANYVDNFLGGSVMEPATRVEVNKKGFCGAHFKQLFDAKNRLSVALMAHTYLKDTIARFERMGVPAPAPRALFAKKASQADDRAERLAEGCILCERLDETMRRYALTLVYMWKKETEFRSALEKSKGFCLKHYAQVLGAAPEELGGAELDQFRRALERVERENLSRIEKELEWFTLKFDYRNQDKPWGESRDALERAINKLRGQCV